jgi:CMP/dCMP kinase
MIIAIDGPAGSGKSSTARAVAERLGYRHLDSGAFYRAITFAAMKRGIPPTQWPRLTPAQLEGLAVSSAPARTGFALYVEGMDVSDEIRSSDVNAAVSAMAAVPAVREWLLQTLRDAACGTDLVADGRDIGTVVFPDADLKVFLVADPRERARRRLLQMGLPDDDADIDAELRRIEARDRTDSGRAVAPLRQADDAIALDTTHLSFDEQVATIVMWARQRVQATRTGADRTGA